MMIHRSSPSGDGRRLIFSPPPFHSRIERRKRRNVVVPLTRTKPSANSCGRVAAEYFREQQPIAQARSQIIRSPGTPPQFLTSLYRDPNNSKNACVARLNFFRFRCTTPTGRARSGACSRTAARRPCASSVRIVRAGRMLIPEPRPPLP